MSEEELPSGLSEKEAIEYLNEHYYFLTLYDDPEWVKEMIEALTET